MLIKYLYQYLYIKVVFSYLSIFRPVAMKTHHYGNVRSC